VEVSGGSEEQLDGEECGGESGGRKEAVNGRNTKICPEDGSNMFLRNILTSITTEIVK
jgi:hypothetical protein